MSPTRSSSRRTGAVTHRSAATGRAERRSHMPVMPGAEPFRHDGGPIGVLLCHGFTGIARSRCAPGRSTSPARGCTVRLPAAARPRHAGGRRCNLTPGRTGTPRSSAPSLELRPGASRSSSWGCRWAGRSPSGWPRSTGDDGRRPRPGQPQPADQATRSLRAAASCSCVVPSVRRSRSDIKKPGEDELAYDRIPLKAAYRLSKLWVVTRADLGKVTQPILMFRSPRTTSSSRTTPRRAQDTVASSDVREVVLARQLPRGDARQRRA